MDEDGDEDIRGLSLAAATETVTAREGTPDADAVRATLSTVASDGVVTDDAVGSAIADVSMGVSNAESRAELAGVRLDDVRTAAEGATDLDTVDVRLSGLEARAEDATSRATDLAADLQSVVERRSAGADVWVIAADLRRIDREADALHGDAHRLVGELDSFEEWLADHDTRLREFRADLDALDGSLTALADGVETLGEEAEAAVGDDPADQWFALVCRHRTTDLVVADARAELADLRALAERADADPGGLDDHAARLDDLDARWADLGDRLEAVAHEAWRERHGDRVATLEADLDGFAPPIDFGAVQAVVEDHQPN